MTIDTETFETEAGRVTEELARRGVEPGRRVTVIVDPQDWLLPGRRESRAAVIAAGLTDEDIDRIIDDARDEVWREQQACASSSTPTS